MTRGEGPDTSDLLTATLSSKRERLLTQVQRPDTIKLPDIDIYAVYEDLNDQATALCIALPWREAADTKGPRRCCKTLHCHCMTCTCKAAPSPIFRHSLCFDVCIPLPLKQREPQRISRKLTSSAAVHVVVGDGGRSSHGRVGRRAGGCGRRRKRGVGHRPGRGRERRERADHRLPPRSRLGEAIVVSNGSPGVHVVVSRCAAAAGIVVVVCRGHGVGQRVGAASIAVVVVVARDAGAVGRNVLVIDCLVASAVRGGGNRVVGAWCLSWSPQANVGQRLSHKAIHFPPH